VPNSGFGDMLELVIGTSHQRFRWQVVPAGSLARPVGARYEDAPKLSREECQLCRFERKGRSRKSRLLTLSRQTRHIVVTAASDPKPTCVAKARIWPTDQFL
jgi:hypothetical protein